MSSQANGLGLNASSQLLTLRLQQLASQQNAQTGGDPSSPIEEQATNAVLRVLSKQNGMKFHPHDPSPRTPRKEEGKKQHTPHGSPARTPERPKIDETTRVVANFTDASPDRPPVHSPTPHHTPADGAVRPKAGLGTLAPKALIFPSGSGSKA